MALEDGITLGILLGTLYKSTPRMPTKQRNTHIPELLQLFEELRKPRTSLNQKGSQSNQFWYQASTPEDMEKRNKVLRSADGLSKCEWKGADLEYQRDLLGFDAKQNAVEAFQDWAKQVLDSDSRQT
jgi:salicylate hydroxylase